MTAVFLALSALVLLCAAIIRPQHATCPRGYELLTGVRSDGRFTCHERTTERWQRANGGGWRDVSQESHVELRGRVYCSGGMRPVISAGEVVGCQPGGWR